MPETVSDWITSLAPLVFIVGSALYAGVSALRGRARSRSGRPAPGVYPGSREHVADLDLAWWRSLSTAEQAGVDEDAVVEGMLAERATAAARAHAEESAQLAVQRAAEINVQFHP